MLEALAKVETEEVDAAADKDKTTEENKIAKTTGLCNSILHKCRSLRLKSNKRICKSILHKCRSLCRSCKL